MSTNPTPRLDLAFAEILYSTALDAFRLASPDTSSAELLKLQAFALMAAERLRVLRQQAQEALQ